MPRVLVDIPEYTVRSADDLKELLQSIQRETAATLTDSTWKLKPGQVRVQANVFPEAHSLDAPAVITLTILGHPTEERDADMDQRLIRLRHKILIDHPWLLDIAKDRDIEPIESIFIPVAEKAWLVAPPEVC